MWINDDYMITICELQRPQRMKQAIDIFQQHPKEVAVLHTKNIDKGIPGQLHDIHKSKQV